jgi:hypothetical protein
VTKKKKLSTVAASVYLSPFADTISPAKPSLPQQQTLPKRGLDPPTDPTNGSRDPLLLFQDLAASGGGSLSRRHLPPQVKTVALRHSV